MVSEIARVRDVISSSEDGDEIRKAADKLQKDSLRIFAEVYRQVT